jgi:hypothetical protein
MIAPKTAHDVDTYHVSAWIDPQGRIYPVAQYGHSGILLRQWSVDARH